MRKQLILKKHSEHMLNIYEFANNTESFQIDCTGDLLTCIQFDVQFESPFFRIVRTDYVAYCVVLRS
jgi:hypothetical protein